jgi:addiction module HigA family antidote
MGRMHNPPHPGESIREDILPDLGVTVTEAAKSLGVSRVTLSRLIHGQAGVSADMARRLEAWLGGPAAVRVRRAGSRCKSTTTFGTPGAGQRRRSFQPARCRGSG